MFHMMLVNVKIDAIFVKGNTYQSNRLYWSFNFEWHSSNEVGKIVIVVLWRDHEKLLPSARPYTEKALM